MRTFARFRLGAARKRQKTVDSRKIDRNQNRKDTILQTVVENTKRKGKKSSNGGCKTELKGKERQNLKNDCKRDRKDRKDGKN